MSELLRDCTSPAALHDKATWAVLLELTGVSVRIHAERKTG